jgi:outer membrane receptor protein involved in Fe transport
LGTSHRLGRFSASTDLFLIDRSNEQVYIPDDGSVEFKEPSRAYGYEVKTALRITKQLSFNAGITQVMNAFFKGTAPRLYIDSSPHTVANGGLTLSLFKGFTGMLGYRHTSNYRLDGEDPSIRASGLDVLDFSLNKQVRRWIEFNLTIDNVLNKRYYETQNYFESRVTPLAEPAFRIHATPGYPFGITAGVTLRLFGKD